MFHKITKVTPLIDYCLKVTFEGNITKIYDVKPLFDRFDIFNHLKENNLFNDVHVDQGGYGVIWNEQIDLSAEEIFTNGKEAM